MKRKVAIQGVAGSFHDIAARNYFEGEEIDHRRNCGMCWIYE